MTDVAAERLAGFSGALRRAGVAVDAARTADFLRAVARLPPRDAAGLRRLGRLVFVRRIEDLAAYEAAFDGWFLDRHAVVPRADGEEERRDDTSPATGERPPEVVEGEGGGKAASADERIAGRRFAAPEADERAALATLAETLRLAMPTLRSRRRVPSRRGDALDLRRTLDRARRSFGVPLELVASMRPPRWRRLMLIIDVSGSLKGHSETFLKAAHALAHAGPATEAFTFGTRLTRITAALRRRSAADALALLSDVVRDADGGTRIGPALARLIEEPRHQSLIRGAVTIVVSDGLERGDPETMRHAVERLARMSHRLVWLTPLAARPDYVPATRAMIAVRPSIDLLDDASSLAAFTRAAAALQPLERAPRGRALHACDLFPPHLATSHFATSRFGATS